MSSPAQHRTLAALGLPALLAAAALASWGRFGNAFAWDDHRHLNLVRELVEQGRVGELWTRGTLSLARVGRPDDGLDLYRPLTLLSFVADGLRAGAEPAAFHLTGLALHLSCVAALYALVARALRPRSAHADAIALGLAGVLGLGPELAEAHVWISGRFDLLCGLFAALAIGAAMRGAALWLGPLSLCALLAKESVLLALVLLPFVPRSEPHAPVSASPSPSRAPASAALAAAVAAYLGLRAYAIGGLGFDHGAAELWAAARRLPLLWLDGALGLLAPHRVHLRSLREDYAPLDPLGCALAALACAAIAVWVVRERRTRLLLAWGLAWYAAALVPAALITTRDWPGFGRLLYVPALGLLLGLGELAGSWLASAAPRLRSRAALVASVVLLAFAVQLHARTADFRSDRVLFEHTIALAPDRAHGYAFLGADHLQQRRVHSAVPLLERAHALAPESRRYLQWLVEALLSAGRRERALAVAEQGIATFGRAPELRLAVAYALIDHDPARACRAVLDCLLEAPEHAGCRELVAFLRTAHPAAPQLRAELDRLLGEPRYRALAPGSRSGPGGGPRP